MDHKLKLALINKLSGKKRAEGFSLIELVVVVSVLAVFSAMQHFSSVVIGGRLIGEV